MKVGVWLVKHILGLNLMEGWTDNLDFVLEMKVDKESLSLSRIWNCLYLALDP
jgi:hypothetical protein